MLLTESGQFSIKLWKNHGGKADEDQFPLTTQHLLMLVFWSIPPALRSSSQLACMTSPRSIMTWKTVFMPWKKKSRWWLILPITLSSVLLVSSEAVMTTSSSNQTTQLILATWRKKRWRRDCSRATIINCGACAVIWATLERRVIPQNSEELLQANSQNRVMKRNKTKLYPRFESPLNNFLEEWPCYGCCWR